MKYRVGYGGPREYRHGQKFPGGRINNGGMTEAERLVHLIASMQILFGSRRGGLLIPLLLVGMVVGGWFVYRNYYSPERALERAHAQFESSDTREQIEAIDAYKRLLLKADPIEPGRHWLLTDRDTLYRRIIQHEILFTENETIAAEWIIKAWDDGLTNLRFQDSKVNTFWEATIKNLQKNRSGSRPATDNPAGAPTAAGQPATGL